MLIQAVIRVSHLFVMIETVNVKKNHQKCANYYEIEDALEIIQDKILNTDEIRESIKNKFRSLIKSITKM